MVKPEWGRKRHCPACGAKFYDLRRSPIVCPSCGANYEQEAVSRPSRRGRGSYAAAATTARGGEAAEAAPELETAEEELETAEESGADYPEDDSNTAEAEEEYEDLIEDASELGEDDDLSEVVSDDDDR